MEGTQLTDLEKTQLRSILNNAVEIGLEKTLNNNFKKNKNTSKVQQLLLYIQQLKQLYNIEKIVKENNQYKLKNEQDTDNFYIMATQFIFLFRSYLQDDDISFLLGAKNDSGKEVSKLYEQKDILQNLEVYKNKGHKYVAIGETFLQTLRQEQSLVKNGTRINQWEAVQRLGQSNSDEKGSNARYTYIIQKNRQKRRLYYKEDKDINVRYRYITVKGGRKMELLYYEKGEQKIFYNMGWLFEWYHSQFYGADDNTYNAIKEDINNESIASIISKKDNVKGTRQGDFRNAQGQWIQSKYGNNKIISYYNILQVIYDLEGVLKILDSNKIDDPKNLEQVIKFFKNNFIPEASQLGEQDVEQYIKEKLKNKLGVNISLTF